MRILAFNASPRKASGNTHRILSPFLEGAAEAGASIETVMARDLTVKPCTACMSCWFRTPGQCVQDDDMAEVLAKLRRADVMVLATPVYVDGMVGTLKVILDRMIPLIHPEMELRDGHMRHPPVEGRTRPKIVLVSVCGLHEMDNFDPLVAHVQAICRNMGGEYVGALLRPHAHGMEALEKFGMPATHVLDACREAGRELVVDGTIRAETLARVSETLMPLDMYLNGANDAMRQLKAKHGAA
ncbi:MAG: flavodoxin family protein [Phycisphaerae bacterium]|nr:flavodoxin family protein [Phycisphaerae bacterium]